MSLIGDVMESAKALYAHQISPIQLYVTQDELLLASTCSISRVPLCQGSTSAVPLCGYYTPTAQLM